MNIYRYLLCVFSLYIFLSATSLTTYASDEVDWSDELPYVSTFNLEESAVTAGDLRVKSGLLEYRNTGNSYTQVVSSYGYSDESAYEFLEYETSTNTSLNPDRLYKHIIQFDSVSGDTLVDVDYDVTIKVSNVATYYSIEGLEHCRIPLDNPSLYGVYAYLDDGTYQDISAYVTVTLSEPATDWGNAFDYLCYDLTLTVKDIPYNLDIIQFVWSFNTLDTSIFSTATTAYGKLRCFLNYSELSYELFGGTSDEGSVDETNSWLETIFNYVKSIWESVVSIPSKLGEMLTSIQQGFVDLGNFIVNLPSQIIDALVGFFLPSEDDLKAYWDKWDKLLSEKLGVFYEAPKIVSSISDSYVGVASVATASDDVYITIPEVVVPLAGTDFVFGPYDVPLVPEGFGFLFDTLRDVISIVCTLAFLVALKAKCDAFIGGA